MKCATCRWFAPTTNGLRRASFAEWTPPDVPGGRCHLNPPDSQIGNFVLVNGEDWCSHHQDRNADDADVAPEPNQTQENT